jgi:hypothetical protein
MHVVLGVDPAAAAGAALFVDGKLLGHCAFDGSTFWSSYDALEGLLKAATIADPVSLTCVIEEGYLSFRSGKGALTLARRRGIAQSAAEALGFRDFVFIVPSNWQGALFGRMATGTSKLHSLARVKQNHQIDVTADVADAINMVEAYMQSNLTQRGTGVTVWHDGTRKRRPTRPVVQAQQNRPKTAAVQSAPGGGPRKRRRTAGPTCTVGE